MTVVSTTKDVDSLSLTLVAEFDATPEHVWEVWQDPRKLERWWGPPTFPATFTRHDFVVGGESRYYMTGPSGDTPGGWFRFHLIDPHCRISFAEGLAGDDGEPVPGQAAASADVTFEVTGRGTLMTAVMHFHDTAQMEMMLEMGLAEGFSQAVGQIDELLSTTSV